MNNQEFERKMNFLMDQHTQFEQRHRVWKVEIEDILTRLARVTNVGFKDLDAKINVLIDAQIRTEERQGKTDEQLHLMTEAQRKTDEQLHLMTGAQRKTDEQLHLMTGAQRKTDEQLHLMTEAQRKTDEQLRLTAEAQRRTEQTLDRYLRSKFNGGNNN